MAPTSLCWEDLQFAVSGRTLDGSKHLLSAGVFGVARSGRTFAIMGPSGAGKTTLLSLLAGDAATLVIGKLSGRITLDGCITQASAIRQQSCLVRQADVLLATATVHETLQFHASLQLPRHMASAAKRARVEQVLGLLGLIGCADTRIGDHQTSIKGISGGERRRLALGLELIKEPAIVFIDEPTTGLDSETALQVMQYIASLAHNHSRMVIFNIHQPNSNIAALFDDLLLLAPGGRAVYSGDSKAALGWFEGLGHTLPQYKAPCDFYMALVADEAALGKLTNAWAEQAALLGEGVGGLCGPAQDVLSLHSGATDAGHFVSMACDSDAARDVVGAGLVDVEKGNRGHRGLSTRTDSSCPAGSYAGGRTAGNAALKVLVTTHSHGMAGQHDSSSLSSSNGGPLFSSGSSGRLITAARQASSEAGSSRASASAPSSTTAFGAGPPVLRERVSWWFEVWVLAQRSWTWWVRNPRMLLSAFLQYMLVCLVLGSIYWQVGSKLPAGAYDRMGGMFALMITIMYTSSSIALVAWDKERTLLKWELSNDTYRLSSFLVSKMMVSIPIEAAQVLIVSTMYYFMMGLARSWTQYWSCMAILTLLAANADIIGHLAIVVTPDMATAIPLLSMTLTLLLVFCGFVVQDIPVYWAWTQKISCCSYAFAALILNEFQGLTLQLPGETRMNADALRFVPDSVRIDQFDTVGAFILVLLAVTGVTLALSVALTLLMVRFKLMGFS